MMQEPQQSPPGFESAMMRKPDHGEESYHGHGRLAGKAAVVRGADSGIGKAVAVAFSREGADIVLSYLDEHDDAKDTAGWWKRQGSARCSLLATWPIRPIASRSSMAA